MFGGNYVTRLFSNQASPHPFFALIDHALLFEGEESLPLFCDRQFDGKSFPVPGEVVQRDGRLVHTPSRDVDLDRNAPPDFSDLPLHKYLAPGPVLPTYASRSCMWKLRILLHSLRQ